MVNKISPQVCVTVTPGTLEENVLTDLQSCLTHQAQLWCMMVCAKCLPTSAVKTSSLLGKTLLSLPSFLATSSRSR